MYLLAGKLAQDVMHQVEPLVFQEGVKWCHGSVGIDHSQAAFVDMNTGML